MDGWNYQRMTTMPTSDADRYAQLLQNLAVRIGAIREAIERAFGVTLPRDHHQRDLRSRRPATTRSAD
jgi:hypothetical protein